jgi:hypothetical protein
VRKGSPCAISDNSRVYRAEGYGYSFAGEAGFISREAFFMPTHVEPTADPAMSSESVKFTMVAMLEQDIGNPVVDQRELILRKYQLMDIPEPEKLVPPPQPNPEMEMAKEKHQLEIEQAQLDSMETMGKMQLMKAQVNKVLTDTQRTAGQHMNDQQRLQMDQIQQQMDAIVAVSELELARRQLEITKTTAQRHLNGKPSQ